MDAAWLVDPQSPRVVVFDRERSEGRDPYLLLIADARTGESRGRVEISGRHGSDSPRVFGPVEGFVWVCNGESNLRLVDLTRGEMVASHEDLVARIGGQTGGDVRVGTTDGRLDAQGRLVVNGADGHRYLLSVDRTVEPAPDAPSSWFDDCRAGLTQLRATRDLIDPSMRACFEVDGETLGFVQHASAAFGDATHRATLFRADGGEAVWTVDTPSLAEADTGWFGHAMPVGDQ